MNILIISQYFFPENFRINDLAESLSEQDINIDVLTAYPNYPYGVLYDGYRQRLFFSEFKFNKVKIHRIPIITRGKGSFIRLSLNYLSFILNSLLIAPLIFRKKNFDVIFVYAPSPIFKAFIGIFLKIIKKNKVVTWVQDLWPESVEVTGYVKNKKLLNLIKYFVSKVYRYSDLILVSSKGFKNKILELSPKSKVMYFPNPGVKIIEYNENKKKIFKFI